MYNQSYWTRWDTDCCPEGQIYDSIKWVFNDLLNLPDVLLLDYCERNTLDNGCDFFKFYRMEPTITMLPDLIISEIKLNKPKKDKTYLKLITNKPLHVIY